MQVPDEMLNEALRDVAKRNNIAFEQMPRDARAAGHRLRLVPRGNAPRDHAVDAAPARRVPAHLRLAARARPGARARRGPGRTSTPSTTSPTSCCRCRKSATTEEMTKVEDAGARHPPPRGRGRGLRPARARVLEGAVRARARQARLAEHGPAAAVHRRPRRQHEARRRQRAGAHADRLPSRARSTARAAATAAR